MFTASYVATTATTCKRAVNANMFASATSTKNYGGAYGGLPTAAPDGRFVTVTQYYNNGISNYNSLTLQYRHMFTYGLSAQLHYTWSHALGTIAYENPFNLSNSYGSLGFDSRHQMAADMLWSQPFKASNKAVNGLIAGWTLAFKMYVYSGAPFNVTDSKIATSVNASGVLTPLADLVVASAQGTQCNAGNSVGQPCLPKTDFATYPGSGINAPLQTDWGNISPNGFRGPGYFDIDDATANLRHPGEVQVRLRHAGLQFAQPPELRQPLGNHYLGRLRNNHQHSGPPYQHLRFGPGRFGFGTPGGSHRDVFVLA